MRKCVSLLLALVMALSLLPGAALAAGSDEVGIIFGKDGVVETKYENGTYTIGGNKSSNPFSKFLVGTKSYSITQLVITGGEIISSNQSISLDEEHEITVDLVLPYEMNDSENTYNIKVLTQNAKTPVISKRLEDDTLATWQSMGTQENIGGEYRSAATFKGLNVSVQNGEGSQYVYINVAGNCIVTLKFVFHASELDTSQDPAREQVESITAVASKSVYHIGDSFSRSDVTVIATLKDGAGTKPVVGFDYEPMTPLTLDDKEITITYGDATTKIPIQVCPAAVIDYTCLAVKNGQLMSTIYNSGAFTLSEKTWADAVIHYGEPYGLFDVTLYQGLDFYVNDVKQEPQGPADENGKITYSVQLNTAVGDIPDADYSYDGGGRNTLKVQNDLGEEGSYEVICYTQALSGMPDKVADYLCIASQYSNGGANGSWNFGFEPQAVLRGVHLDTATGLSLRAPKSVGGLGGYITLYYKDPIKDDPKNPYGIDFIVCGNSVDGTSGFSENGQVWVSENGEDFYALAGSLHYSDFATWGTVTYKNQNGSTVLYSGGSSKDTRWKFPVEKYYPLFKWTEENRNEITLPVVQLSEVESKNEYGNILPPYPNFGYADVGIISGDNHAQNPYDAFAYDSNPSQQRLHSSEVDGFDLAWAVDSDGNWKDLSNMDIHYVKISSCLSIDNGAIGEKSPEILLMRTVASNAMPVGVTAKPNTITVDGVALDLSDDQVSSYTADVNGPFEVKVDAPKGVNIHINETNVSLFDNSVVYDTMPKHKMLRIIVQQGIAEPRQYFITLNEDPDSAADARDFQEVTFDTASDVPGSVPYFADGSKKLTRYYAADSSDAFPIPKDYENKGTFIGWKIADDESGTVYTNYGDIPSEKKVGDLTLTAVWTPAEQSPEGPEKPGTEDNIQVSFRLIGSSLAKLEDESDGIDLGGGDYKGAEYQNWIPTRTYTMKKGDTVLDLIETALGQAGIEFENPSGNYITAIYAPTSMGGYRLAEMTNGPHSGWMYTRNGNHSLNGISEQPLSANDKVIVHYVNDYAYEVADWDRLGGVGYPALGNSTYHNAWLKATDGTTGSGSGTGETPKTPSRTEVSGGKANVTIEDEDIPMNGTGYTVIAPDESAAEADSVTATLTGKQANEVAERSVGLRLESELGSASLTARGMKDLGLKESDQLTLTVEQDGKGNTTVQAAVNGRTVETVTGGIRADLPAAAGNVLVVVESDGSETIVRKSIVENGRAAALLDGSCTVKVIDNSKDFADVAAGAWYAGAVDFASSHELFNGTGGNAFSPDAPMTRGMLATVLWRLEDEEAAGTPGTFADVAADSWYSSGIAWASERGIVTGYGGGRFGPGDNITREQLAVMLYRYMSGMDLSAADGDLSGYTDGGQVSGYAAEAMAWAVGSGVLQGVGGCRLDPAGSASRAQVAAMLQRVARLIAA